MRYMLLIYVDPEASPARAPERCRDPEVDRGLRGAGGGRRAAGRRPARGRRDGDHRRACRGGQQLTTDGPFAETKELLGGYYMIDVDDLDQALAWAAKMPNIAYGSVEVRPIRDFP